MRLPNKGKAFKEKERLSKKTKASKQRKTMPH